MTLLAERIVVVTREFLTDKNINECKEFNEPMFRAKLNHFGWDLPFAAGAIVCELIWKIAIGRESLGEYTNLDRLFSPSPIATHANFRGSKNYKTGSLPEVGALAVYRRGNSWQGYMAIVTNVPDDKQSFDVAEGRILDGSEDRFLTLTEKTGKRMGLPFREDKLNLVGFIYPPNRTIN